MSGLELHLQSRFSFGGVQLHDRWLLKPEVVRGTASFFVFAKKACTCPLLIRHVFMGDRLGQFSGDRGHFL